MIEPDEVTQGYRWILGRTPESAAMRDYHSRHKDFETARFRLLNSPEFRDIYSRYYLDRPFIWFIHIPKTAGTAVRNGFSLVFGERFFWHPVTAGLEDQSGSVFAAIRSTNNFFNTYDFCGGHLSKDLVPLRNSVRRVIFISILRDPVNRALSMYSHARRKVDHDAHQEVKDRTLWEALQLKGVFYHHVYQEQIRYLCGFRDSDALERAWSEDGYILCDVSAISLLLERLNRKFGIPMPDLDTANANPLGYVEEIRKQHNFDSAVSLIQEINEAEYVLLKRCESLFDSTR